jgi:4-hydroxybenzoate polyprenyltransferase
MVYFQLIRFQNLILLALMQLVLRYGFLKYHADGLALADWQYLLLVLATVLIAGAGYVINDIFDQDADEVNHLKKRIVGNIISEGKAYNLYVALNITGVGIGFYLSNVIGKPGFVTLFILIAASLYFYATTLKKYMIIGNILIATLASISILIIGFFDLFPATHPYNRGQMKLLFELLIDFALFAFMIHFIREIVKDAEDIKGDKVQGRKTLPLVMGTRVTSLVLSVLILISCAVVGWYVYKNLMLNTLYPAVIYGLVTIITPLIYLFIKSIEAKTAVDFNHISKVLKWVIFFGLFASAVITYSILHHA